MSVSTGVSAYYKRVRQDLPNFAKGEAEHCGDLSVAEVAKLTPVGERIDEQTGEPLGPSGRAKRSWKRIPVRSDRAGSYDSGASSDVEYIPELDTGARAHIIPRGGRAAGIWLRFYSQHHKRFAREVHHPGMRGHFMMERGLREAERVYQEEIGRRYQDFLDRQDRR